MTRVRLEDIAVMCVRAEDGPAGAATAFDALESRLATLHGRRFYGTFLNGEYRACVEVGTDEDPASLGLETWHIPGGEYERLRLPDWQDRVSEIAAILRDMVPAPEVDTSRPSIEFYRSARELVLLQPVRDVVVG